MFFQKGPLGQFTVPWEWEILEDGMKVLYA